MQRPEFYCLIATRAIVRSAVVALAALLLAAMPGAARAETPVGCATPPTNDVIAYRCKFYDGRSRTSLRGRVSALRPQSGAGPRYRRDLAIELESALPKSIRLRSRRPVQLSQGHDLRRAGVRGMAVAPAIGPTRDLFGLAKAEHVTVFFVTGRCEGAIERAATEINLHRAGYGGWRHLYLRIKQFNSDRSVSPYKTWMRGEIEAQGYTIIANVGDQWSDSKTATPSASSSCRIRST